MLGEVRRVSPTVGVGVGGGGDSRFRGKGGDEGGGVYRDDESSRA
jgi:hypothetical protein